MKTIEDFVLIGRNPETGGKNVYGKQLQFTKFAVFDSEYADDTANSTTIPLCTRADDEEYTPLLMEHFRRWSLKVHGSRRILSSF